MLDLLKTAEISAFVTGLVVLKRPSSGPQTQRWYVTKLKINTAHSFD